VKRVRGEVERGIKKKFPRKTRKTRPAAEKKSKKGPAGFTTHGESQPKRKKVDEIAVG